MSRPRLRHWVAANAVGEGLGLGLGALAAVPAQAWLETRLPALVAAAVAATGFAVVEGLVVGAAQGVVVHRLAPRVSVRRWVAATMVGGWVAWLAVTVPFALGAGGDTGASAQAEPPLWVQLAVMALAGLAAGPVLGVPQALALRVGVARPWRWVWANAKAWAVGLPVVQLVAGGMPQTWPVPVMVAVGLAALCLAGGVVGLVHGPTLLRLTGEPRPAGGRRSGARPGSVGVSPGAS